VEPVYDTLPGWQPPTHGLRDAVQLLPETRICVSLIEVLVGVSVALLSTGAERQDAGVLAPVVLSARA
jgi:adenylosuccinate synthase